MELFDDQFNPLDNELFQTCDELRQSNKTLGKKIELMDKLATEFHHRSQNINSIDVNKLLHEEENTLMQQVADFLKLYDQSPHALPQQLDKFSPFLAQLSGQLDVELEEIKGQVTQLEKERQSLVNSLESSAAELSQLQKEREVVSHDLNEEKKRCNVLSKKFNVQYRKSNDDGQLTVVVKQEGDQTTRKLFTVDLERLKSGNDPDYIRQVRTLFCAQYKIKQDNSPK